MPFAEKTIEKFGGDSGLDFGIPLEGMTFSDPDADGNRSSEIQICMTGSFTHPWYGDFDITSTQLRRMKKNFASTDRKEMIDYNHASYSGDPDRAVAAGWMNKNYGLKVRANGDKLYCLVDWTPKAVEMIENREYLFISPEIDWEYTEPKTGENVGASILAAALTNRPFLEGMDEVSLSTVYFSTSSQFQPSSSKTERGKTGGEKMLKDELVREILELSATVEVTEEHQNKAIVKLALIREESLNQASQGNNDPAPENDPAPTPESTPDPDTVQLSRSEYNEMKNNAQIGADAALKLKKAEVDSMIQLGLQNGQIAPAQVESLTTLANKDFAQAKSIIDSAPKRPELFKAIGSEDGGEHSETTDALTEFEANQGFYSNLGITKEDLEKYGHILAE